MGVGLISALRSAISRHDAWKEDDNAILPWVGMSPSDGGD